jgi:hypothetical protein
LQFLDISAGRRSLVRIGDAGAQALAARLPECLSLQHLNLSNNDIKDRGANAFVACLRNFQCPSLKVINLSHNRVMKKGGKDILEDAVRPGLTVQREGQAPRRQNS